jgi:hypothetical protein
LAQPKRFRRILCAPIAEFLPQHAEPQAQRDWGKNHLRESPGLSVVRHVILMV